MYPGHRRAAIAGDVLEWFLNGDPMPLQTAEIKPIVVDLVEEILNQGDSFDLDDPITLDTCLIGDLDFASVDFVQLCVGIEERIGQKLGFHDLLMQNGQYVDDLSVGQFVEFIDKRLNSPDQAFQSGPTQQIGVPESEKLSPEVFAIARQAIPAPPHRQPAADAKNKPAAFVLCPSRSGSTLLQIILAGHPQLFAPPELHLLTYGSLPERKAALSNALNSHLLSGTVRAIMQAKGCPSAEAEQMMQAFEDQQMTTKAFYRELQGLIGDRLLVDKTPSYTYHLEIIQWAEQDFSDALFIHLVRHPCGMIRSFEDAQMERLIPFMHQAMTDGIFTRRQLAELAWVICHQNILDLLKTVPAHRQLRVKYEDLVTQPQSTVEGICQFLGLTLHPDMLEPYRDKQNRMTDGVENVTQMSGDLKFHLHQRIEPEMADRWKQYYTTDFLSDTTRQLASSFGYSF